jgi:predicted nuclease of predicted toxin-antitoxin system
MKFLLDMGISPRTAEYLRGLGHNAVHLVEQHLHRLPDPQIIEKARSENRIILTHDLDFGSLMAASRQQLPSIIIFRLTSMRPENIHVYLELILNDHSSALVEGVILSVSEQLIRVRQLPIS